MMDNQNDRKYMISSGDISLELSMDGEITSVTLKDKKIKRNLSGSTNLAGCNPQGKIVSKKLEAGGVEFTKNLVDKRNCRQCTLIERFIPAEDSLRWEVEIWGQGETWSTPIETQLNYPHTESAKFWTAWADARHGKIALMSNTEQIAQGILPAVANGSNWNWSDPLIPVPFSNMKLWYGAPHYDYNNPRIGYCPVQTDVFCIPIATIIEEKEDIGFSLVLSLEDTLLDVTLETSEEGKIVFSRLFHRISNNKPTCFSMDLVKHKGDWRDGLGWMSQHYSTFFNPPNPKTYEIAGTGAYSIYEGDFDVTKMKRMSFRVNWKASFDFPYMGMFLPPVEDNKKWTSFGGRKTSIAQMRFYSHKMRKMGFHVLNYFNVAEFGTNVKYPAPRRKTRKESDLWQNCNDFLYTKLADAILYVPKDAKSVDTIYGRLSPNKPYYSWENSIVLDPGEPVWQEFLIDQVKRHICKIPDSAGICIDRMDWLRLYNDRRDDGVSWFGDKPTRSLLISWQDLMNKIGPLMHKADKVIYCNNHTKRIELLRQIDGLFDEFAYAGASMNTSALLGVYKPVLGWVRWKEDFQPNPDLFFQKCLYLGIYPMAPFPGNDHSILPNKSIEKYYLDYGPLLNAMRGKKWVLRPHVIEVKDHLAKANIFKVPGGFIIPVVFGGEVSRAKVIIRNLPDTIESKIEAIHPGSEKWISVNACRTDKSIEIDVPLQRGCAMVRIR